MPVDVAGYKLSNEAAITIGAAVAAVLLGVLLQRRSTTLVATGTPVGVAGPQGPPGPSASPWTSTPMTGTPGGSSAPSGLAHWSYTVQPGDNLWAIAQTQLGDGNQWRAISALNPNSLTNPNLVSPGMVLAMP